MNLQEQVSIISPMMDIPDIIGYFKYETHSSSFNEFVSEYPITDDIIKYIKKLGYIKIEFDGNNPRLINDKLIALI